MHEIGLVVHPVHTWIGGSADGVTESGKLIEIKCPMSRKLDGTIPKYYIPQVQVLMEVLDLDECDFIQFNVATGEFQLNTVSRDREWFSASLPVLSEFWQRVLDRRLRPLCEIQYCSQTLPDQQSGGTRSD